jgi:hypothetical protein
MQSFDMVPLQVAAHSALMESDVLMALITGVYDAVPQEAVCPYLVWGECSAKPWGELGAQGMEQLITLNSYSQSAGRRETADIMRVTQELLNHAPLEVDGYVLVLLRVRSIKVELEKDGLTYKGSLQMSALLRQV